MILYDLTNFITSNKKINLFTCKTLLINKPQYNNFRTKQHAYAATESNESAYPQIPAKEITFFYAEDQMISANAIFSIETVQPSDLTAF